MAFKVLVLVSLISACHALAETDPAYYDPVEYQPYVHHYSNPFMPYTAFQYRPHGFASQPETADKMKPVMEDKMKTKPVVKSVPASIISTLPAAPLAPTYDTGFYTANPGGLIWNPLPYAFGTRTPYFYY